MHIFSETYIQQQERTRRNAKARNFLVIALKLISSITLLFIMIKLLGKIPVAFTPAQAQVVSYVLYLACLSLHATVWRR